MTRHDPESARWLEIAEAYGTPREERSYRMYRIAQGGLCSAYVNVIGGAFFGSNTVFGSTYLTYEFDEEADAYRRDVAMLFAAMSPDERREIGLPA